MFGWFENGAAGADVGVATEAGVPNGDVGAAGAAGAAEATGATVGTGVAVDAGVGVDVGVAEATGATVGTGVAVDAGVGVDVGVAADAGAELANGEARVETCVCAGTGAVAANGFTGAVALLVVSDGSFGVILLSSLRFS